MTTSHFPTTRLRRLRMHPKVRDLVRENTLSKNDLVQPLFIRHGHGEKIPIQSMPGQFQLPLNQLAAEIEEIVNLAIPAVLLFGIPAQKDALGSESYADEGIIQQALAIIKKSAPELLVITDVCFCEYTDHGHCGVIEGKEVNNDSTLELLGRQALSHVKHGADMIAPSGMMDGMVAAIRQTLDAANFTTVPILSYAVKYASSLYGPFREAAEGAPQFGDRKSYQMDPANSNEALREAKLDLNEGADILMVKPAIAYLDIIARLKQAHPEVPLVAYQVSGEYSMIKAAAANGWIAEQAVVMESLIACKRAGANFIISYFAKDVARWLNAITAV